MQVSIVYAFFGGDYFVPIPVRAASSARLCLHVIGNRSGTASGGTASAPQPICIVACVRIWLLSRLHQLWVPGKLAFLNRFAL
jgi:hypothetical protein